MSLSSRIIKKINESNKNISEEIKFRHRREYEISKNMTKEEAREIVKKAEVYHYKSIDNESAIVKFDDENVFFCNKYGDILPAVKSGRSWVKRDGFPDTEENMIYKQAMIKMWYELKLPVARFLNHYF